MDIKQMANRQLKRGLLALSIFFITMILINLYQDQPFKNLVVEAGISFGLAVGFIVGTLGMSLAIKEDQK